jgi:hypothetical protein
MKNSYPKKPLAIAAALLTACTMHAQILFDNTPISNSPGTGFNGADESVLYTTTFGMGTIGFGHQATAFNRVADDFVSTDCQWVVDSIVFFGYQTGSGTTSTFTGVNFRIWDSIPDAVGSSVVYGDTTTNRMTRSVFTGVYRVTQTTATNSTRPIMRNVCTTPGLTLPAGTYWLDWASLGSLASGPWAVPRTPLNQSVTGNGRQRIGSVWNNALDGGTNTPQQGFPFLIYGHAVNPTADAGVDASICEDASAVLGGTPAGTGTGQLSYMWSPAVTLNNAAIDHPTATPTATTTYVLTVTDALGCSVTDDVEIEILAPATSTLTETVCSSYNSPAGNTYTSSGTYLDTIPNFIGCDSIITINLTVNQPTTNSITATSCYSYLSPAGNTYTTTGTYNETLTNAMGCDSLITINLTINGETTVTLTESACDSYTSPSGMVLTASGTYMDTIANVNGCDSVITIQLTINTVNVGVTMTGVMLTADAMNAAYQWVNCDSGYTVIQGETSQTFFPLTDGNYAVIVTENSCTDTSACTLVIGTGIVNPAIDNIALYPNPSEGNVLITLGSVFAEVSVVITDAQGRTVYAQTANGVSQMEMNPALESGIYFVSIYADGAVATKQLIRK